MGNVFGYVFIEESDNELMALYQQQQTLMHYASEKGLRIGDFFVEKGVSLRKSFRERIEANKLLDAIQPNDIVLVWKSKYVLGSAKEGLWFVDYFRERSVGFYAVDLDENLTLPEPRKLQVTEGGANLVRGLLVALSQCESSYHGETIKAAKKQMKKEGKYLGGPVPFGFVVKKERLVKNKEEQKIIKKILKYRKDRWSYRDISKKLKEEEGLSLSHEGIRKIVKNQGVGE